MLRTTAWVVTIGAGLAFAAAPAFAADMPAKKAETHQASRHHHKMTCYDYAWESQAQKDCLAKPAAEHKPAMHHRGHRHPMKKPIDKPMEKKS